MTIGVIAIVPMKQFVGHRDFGTRSEIRFQSHVSQTKNTIVTDGRFIPAVGTGDRGGVRMPHSFLRGRWLRTLTAPAVVMLSIGSAINLDAADASRVPDAGGLQTSLVRETELEDHGQYPGLTIVRPGVSSKVIRKQAITGLGVERLSPEAQTKSASVLKNIGMFRRLPTISFECDPDVYAYFLKNPDVAVSTWRAMEISQFQLHETTTNLYRADAGDGSVGNVELFLRTPTETLIHCDGAFKSPLLPKPIIARSLMRVQTSFSREADGRIIATHSGDVFVEFPSTAVEAVAKVISPVSHTIADRNFKQMTLFVHLMSQAMSRHPGWIQQIGNKLEGVTADKKIEFLETAARSNAESRRRFGLPSGLPVFSPEEVLIPFRQGISQQSDAATPALMDARNNRTIQTASQSGTVTRPK